MTPAEVEDTVSAVFAAAIGAVPVAWDNVSFDSKGLDEYVRFSMQFNGGTNPEIEGKQFRRFGVFFVQVFTEANSGKSRARELAEVSLAIFEGQTIGPARFRNVGIVDVGVSDRWFQSNVSGEFEYDQFR